MTKQVPLSELLQDPIFRKWSSLEPPHKGYELWRVYVQRKKRGPWARRDFKSWKKAHKFWLKHRDEWYDSALICRNGNYKPPVVKVGKKRRYAPITWRLGHHWCEYCRRPTVFKVFYRHHMRPGHTIMQVPRCTICGISLQALKRY